MKRLSLLACVIAMGITTACAPPDPTRLTSTGRRPGAHSVETPKASAPANGKRDGGAEAGTAQRTKDGGAATADGATASTDAATDAQGTADAGTGTASVEAGTPKAGPEGFSDAQRHNLDAINQYRAAQGAPPLVLDATMSNFATLSSQGMSADHVPHALFLSSQADGSLASGYGFAGGANQTQGDSNGWPALADDAMENQIAQIDAVLQSMFEEGPGGANHDILVSSTTKRLGVGLVDVDGRLYLTNAFSE